MGSPLSFSLWRAFINLCSFVTACAHTLNYGPAPQKESNQRSLLWRLFSRPRARLIGEQQQHARAAGGAAMAEAQPPTELAVKELNTTTGGEAWCAAAAAATNALQPTCRLSVRRTHKIDSFLHGAQPTGSSR